MQGRWFDAANRVGPSRPGAGVRVTATAQDDLRKKFFDGLRFALSKEVTWLRKSRSESSALDEISSLRLICGNEKRPVQWLAHELMT